MACDRLKKRCTIGRILSDRSDLVERRRISDETETGDGSVCRLDPRDAAVGTRLADGSAGIRAERRKALTRSDRRTGAAGRTARNVFRIPRVSRNLKCRRLCRTSHRELVHVCLSEDHHSGIRDPGDCRCVIERDEVFQDL